MSWLGNALFVIAIMRYGDWDVDEDVMAKLGKLGEIVFLKRYMRPGAEDLSLGVCPTIRSWSRKPPRNNLLTAIWTLSWSY